MRRKYSFDNFMDILPLIITILIVTVVWAYMDLEYDRLFHMIKRMETLFNGIRWFVDANYMIIGMLVIAAMIAFVETTKVGDNDE